MAESGAVRIAALLVCCVNKKGAASLAGKALSWLVFLCLAPGCVIRDLVSVALVEIYAEVSWDGVV